jgi:hypothetical protein
MHTENVFFNIAGTNKNLLGYPSKTNSKDVFSHNLLCIDGYDETLKPYSIFIVIDSGR